MSGDKILLDSVILIDHFNAVARATAYLKSVGESAFISAITRAEVLTGFDATNAALARTLLDRYALLPIDGPVADMSAALRREHGWRLPDALQVACALCHGLKLATRNTKDFSSRLPFVVIPYRI